jgi:glycosyltransferase involved in cell wall biosynthesis
MSAGVLGRSTALARGAASTTDTHPRVSVVIPCYNYKRFLPEAVESVLSQQGVDLDIIIVDDASTDGSSQLAQELAEANSCIRAVLHPTNMGHIATYNDGLARVTGDYVVLLSSDDLLAPGSLARSTALMEQHPEVALVYGYAQDFCDTPAAGAARRTTWSVWSGEAWITHLCRRGSNIIVNPEAVLRRSVMDALVGYRPEMPHAADMDLWLRAASLGGVGRINGPVQAYYRVHGQNMHLTDFGSPLDDIRARREVFHGLSDLPGPPLQRPRQLLRAAHRALAVEAVREAIHLADTRPELSASAEKLAAFGSDTDASVTESRLWSSYLRRRNDGTWPLERTLTSAAYRWRWAYRWRRWRRAGI